MTAIEVEALLRDIHDPEIPAVSIVDLGMVEQVTCQEDRVSVSLIPTFVGCPAQRLIAGQVKRRLEQQYPDVRVEVEFSLSPAWTSSRITDAGRKALKGSGIAPPGRDLDDVACPYCGQRDTVMQNLFASTSCRSLYYCRSCRNPFEAFKPIA